MIVVMDRGVYDCGENVGMDGGVYDCGESVVMNGGTGMVHGLNYESELVFVEKCSITRKSSVHLCSHLRNSAVRLTDFLHSGDWGASSRIRTTNLCHWRLEH